MILLVGAVAHDQGQRRFLIGFCHGQIRYRGVLLKLAHPVSLCLQVLHRHNDLSGRLRLHAFPCQLKVVLQVDAPFDQIQPFRCGQPCVHGVQEHGVPGGISGLRG